MVAPFDALQMPAFLFKQSREFFARYAFHTAISNTLALSESYAATSTDKQASTAS